MPMFFWSQTEQREFTFESRVSLKKMVKTTLKKVNNTRVVAAAATPSVSSVTAAGAGAVGKTKRRKHHNTTGFEIYIHKVLKQVHPNHGISRKAMIVMNSMCTDMFERVCIEAARVARYSKRNTLTSKDIQVATRLIFPGELSKHAVSAGVKSVAQFNASQ